MFIGAIVKEEHLADTSGTFRVPKSGPKLSCLRESSPELQATSASLTRRRRRDSRDRDYHMKKPRHPLKIFNYFYLRIINMKRNILYRQF